jgi:prepilin-type N-terminal cleavage/methylation domain-containing protein/prepilin-type processing-associated H-X9-DG protein
MRRPIPQRGFTLVELLVVIGIIALLISILLPALNSARRSAAQTKCAAQMKEMYNGFLFYAQDHKGYWPPTRMSIASGSTYNLYDNTWPISGTSPYYYDFVAKYLTKKKVSVTSGTAEDAADARQSVIWGCPSWEGYASTTIGGVNRAQTGIGMNGWPTFTPENPPVGGAANFPTPTSETTGFVTWTNGRVTAGTWQPAVRWGKQGANRMLLSDSRFWLAESNPAPANGQFPPQPNINNIDTYTSGISGQTTVDVYRHGKYPGQGPAPRTFAATGGKVAYNILYCDGHVSGQNDQKAAYESIRQRFPG